MSEEPDNLVLKLQREIRDNQQSHDEKFQQLATKLDELSESVTYSLGLSAHANVRHETVQKKIENLEARLKALESRIH